MAHKELQDGTLLLTSPAPSNTHFPTVIFTVPRSHLGALYLHTLLTLAVSPQTVCELLLNFQNSP